LELVSATPAGTGVLICTYRPASGWVKITRTGRAALRREIHALQDLIDTLTATDRTTAAARVDPASPRPER
jgi:hypothetical protein